MPEGWARNDRALCVKLFDPVDLPMSLGLRVGQVHDVKAVKLERTLDGVLRVGLRFHDLPDPPMFGWWNAECFRKLDPHARDADDNEVIAALNGAPLVVTL